ncbi:MAG TPA: molybdopterin cofactor-binding domain-containing protein, partial [Burkholderiaceae bacterium]|nr:molybdopterin cofactor-binding domain-containing protein [Burkholderiaceae bacterium]
MIIHHLLQSATASPPIVTRRRFVTMSVGGSVGLALLPWAAAQQKADVAPGQKPTEQPSAFVSIAPDGTTTVICNRMDMGQGIETALAMVCAEELGADWSKVKTGFGTAAPNYVDPAFGMHLTGGSNSVKNSYTQYRELGARTRAMLIAAAAKRWSVPASSLTAANGVVRGSGHTAGYGELFDAAMKEPIPEQVALKEPKDFKLIGKPTGLKVSRAKSSGQQTYGMDIKLPDMLVAVIAHPPVFGAKVKTFDAAAAQKVTGVRAVLPVELDRGGRGVAVVASGYWPAKTGRDALKPDWDTEGLEKVDSMKQLASYRELARTAGTPAPGEHFRADVSRIVTAPQRIEAEFVFPYLNHAQMEPLACTVDLKDDRCDIYTASQMPGVDAMAIGKSTGLAPERVHIHVQMGGGGFGRRAVPTSDYLLESVAVAKALAAAGQRAPVKVIWSREDDLRAGYYRPFTVHRAEIGFDAQGNVLGWDHRIVSQSIVGGTPFEAFMIKEGVDATTTEGMREPYAVPMRLQVHHPKVNVPVLWWRSVGSTHTAFVMETLIDEIADATKQDPLAYRLKLMGNGPEHARHRAALQLAADKAGYGRKTLARGMHWGVAVHESFESVVAYVLEAGIKDGKPVIGAVTAGVHCNFCVNPRTVEAQVFGAAVMGLSTTLPGAAITFKDGVVEQSNFGDYTVARLTDVPKIAVHIVPSTDPPKGMGEPG